jgi:prevent-host-death family protein
MTRVGIRELKQNASAVVRRVRGGEVVEVTDRGRPVALMVPIPQDGGVVERMVAEGRATPALARGSLADLPPPLRLPKGRTPPSKVLDEMREEDR